jgi:hypothetical protein
VAISIIALVISAIAVVTSIALWKATKDDAEASRQAVRLTRLQMRQAQMPVVMPVADRGTDEEGMRSRIGPHMVGPGNPVPLIVPVRNAGAGAALDIRAEVRFGDTAGNLSAVGQPSEISPLTYGVLGADQATELQGRYGSNLASPLLSLQITLIYDDVFGAPYKSAATYVETDRSYRDIVYDPPAELDPEHTASGQ